MTDGGEEVRSLTELVTPEVEHVLGWFHTTMRLTVLSQYARGVAHHDKSEGARLLASLDSIKWLLWHGNQHRAGEEIAFLEDEVDGLVMDYPNLGKFVRAAHRFAVYIASRCSGPSAVRTCCCKPERGRSTARSDRCSSADIRGWPTTMETVLLELPQHEHPIHPDGLHSG